MPNILSSIPESLSRELIESLLDTGNVRIERIVSRGHRSPEIGWYDQDEDEWVLVLEGSGLIAFEDGADILLEKGDYLNIPAHVKHRVAWTDPTRDTIWLAVFHGGARAQTVKDT